MQEPREDAGVVSKQNPGEGHGLLCYACGWVMGGRVQGGDGFCGRWVR